MHSIIIVINELVMYIILLLLSYYYHTVCTRVCILPAVVVLCIEYYIYTHIYII